MILFKLIFWRKLWRGVPRLPGDYVPRPKLERRILNHITKARPSGYMVVVGPRGAGKSYLIAKLLAGRPLVVYARVTPSKPTVADAVGCDLVQVLGRYQTPVVVVEIDGVVATEPAQFLKLLCSDYGLAHGIIVLDDASLLTKDPHRQDFLWVGDYSTDQVHRYLDQRGVLVGEDRRFLDAFGGNAQALFTLANGAIASDNQTAFIVAQIDLHLQRARNDVDLAVAQVPALIPVLETLVAKGHVAPARLGIQPKELMLEDHAVVTYNSETRNLVFASKPHELAARAWLDDNQPQPRLWTFFRGSHDRPPRNKKNATTEQQKETLLFRLVGRRLTHWASSRGFYLVLR